MVHTLPFLQKMLTVPGLVMALVAMQERVEPLQVGAELIGGLETFHLLAREPFAQACDVPPRELRRPANEAKQQRDGERQSDDAGS